MGYFMTIGHRIIFLNFQNDFPYMSTSDRKARLFREREAEIIETAKRLFAEKGVDVVTIEMISDAVGIGKGTVYKHFKTKDDLFATIYLEQANQLALKFQSVDPHLPVLERLRALLQIVMQESWEKLQEGRIFHECFHSINRLALSEDSKRMIEQHYNNEIQMFTAIIQEGVDQGIFRDDVPASYMTLMGEGLLHGIHNLLIEGAEVDDMKTLLAFIENVMIRGILKT